MKHIAPHDRPCEKLARLGPAGLGFAKVPYLQIELSPDTIALMRRVKHAFDPEGILNPGQVFPPDPAGPD